MNGLLPSLWERFYESSLDVKPWTYIKLKHQTKVFLTCLGKLSQKNLVFPVWIVKQSKISKSNLNFWTVSIRFAFLACPESNKKFSCSSRLLTETKKLDLGHAFQNTCKLFRDSLITMWCKINLTGKYFL